MSQVEHCHIYVTDAKTSGVLDYIFFDIQKAIIAFCNMSYDIFGSPDNTNRVLTEKQIYDFIQHPSSKDTGLSRGNKKVVIGFHMCNQCNMAALN